MAIQAQLYQENLGFPLCGSQDWLMENGCGSLGGGFNQFCISLQQPKNHHQQQQILIQELQNLNQKNDKFLYDTTSSIPMAYYSQSIADQVERQRQEIDQYIKLHNERLRLVLQEHRKQQMAMLLKRVEPKLVSLLREKDEEIARVAKKKMELEELLRKLESENQAWQRVAQENEAMVLSLNNTLEQAKEMASFCPNNGAEDAESCCDVDMEKNRDEEEEQRTGENRGKKAGTVISDCKVCNSRGSCVLFLPCRHLCSCKACEAFLDSCPVCRTPKKASIEALIF